MLDPLHDALVAGDWPLALERALEVWRDTRDPELADLIDRITERCTLPSPPDDKPAEQQRWFLERGIVEGPDPVTTAGLLAILIERADYLDGKIEDVRARWRTAPRTPLNQHLATSNRWPSNFQERVGVVLQWPPDPRVAIKLVHALRAPHAPHAHGIPEMYDALGDRIGEINDVRVRELLGVMAAEPRGANTIVRALQTAFANRALTRLATEKPPRPIGAELAACVALLPISSGIPLPPPRRELDQLWHEVAANPDDVGVRSVLGDALVEAGDLRGDIIVLQCNVRVENRPLRSANRKDYDGRIKTLLRKRWDTWFGDLALVLPRRACEFRCGMLEVATVGMAAAPEWAYAKARGHRELACVHTVRPGWITTDLYATFILGLPRFPHTLGATGIDVFEAIATRGATFDRLRTLELVRSSITGDGDRPLPDWASKPLRDALARVAVLAPGLRELVVRDHTIAERFVTFRREVRLLFPNLKKLAVDKPTALLVQHLVDDNTFTVV